MQLSKDLHDDDIIIIREGHDLWPIPVAAPIGNACACCFCRGILI